MGQIPYQARIIQAQFFIFMSVIDAYLNFNFIEGQYKSTKVCIHQLLRQKLEYYVIIITSQTYFFSHIHQLFLHRYFKKNYSRYFNFDEHLLKFLIIYLNFLSLSSNYFKFVIFKFSLLVKQNYFNILIQFIFLIHKLLLHFDVNNLQW